MKYFGNKSGAFGAFEIKRVIDWLAPVALTALLTYASSWIAYLHDQGGWRAVLASVLVMVGRGIYAWARDNSRDRT